MAMTKPLIASSCALRTARAMKSHKVFAMMKSYIAGKMVYWAIRRSSCSENQWESYLGFSLRMVKRSNFHRKRWMRSDGEGGWMLLVPFALVMG